MLLRHLTRISSSKWKIASSTQGCVSKKAGLLPWLPPIISLYHGSSSRNCQTTVGELCQDWTIKLSLSGIPEAREASELIIANILQLPTLHNIPKNVTLTQDQIIQVKLKCEKRMQRIPLQYIIGEWDFCDLTLQMVPPVFIPRPETEELVNFALNYLNNKENKDKKGRFLEIGCGSGAISLALLNKLPQWSCIAVDISKQACSLTNKNAELCQLTDRIKVLEHDINQDVEVLQELCPFDFLISNPPYISLKDMKRLQPEIANFEDHRALCGGEDGLDTIKAILRVARHLVSVSGSIWLEVDCGHVLDLYKWVMNNRELCLRTINIYADHTGRDRFCHFMRIREGDSLPSCR